MIASVATLAALLVLPPVNTPAPTIRASLANLDYGAVEVSPEKPASALQAPAGKPQRSVGRKVAGGVVGAVVGFFAGGYLGAMIEGDCGCDDPGLTGFIYGAPIGAIVGGILGAKF